MMARLWLIAVLLLSSASAGSSVENPVKVDQNKNPAFFQRPNLAQISQTVNNLLNRLNGDPRLPMFSLAVSIPYNNNKKEYDVSKVTDDPKKVKDTILGCGVYTSERMVAATVLKWDDVLKQCPDAVKGRADHAEYRVLQNFKTLKDNPKNKQDFLLFYVYASPCDQKCTSTTSHFSILESINVIKNWTNYAVVFSKVFKPKVGEPVHKENLKEALERLGKHDGLLGPIGLENIYRCDGSKCTSCSSNNLVTPCCYDGTEPDPSNNAPSNSVIGPPGGKN